MTDRKRLIPGPEHPITVADTGERVIARVAGRVLAETTRALTLREADYPPVYYIPLDDVDEDALTATRTHTYCPYKGDASYYTVTVPGGPLADAVWYYPEPYDAVARIAGHVAFYADRVDVTTEPA
jgi:uncharacterized protein (DUF427 family)